MQRQSCDRCYRKIDFVFYNQRNIERAVRNARQDKGHVQECFGSGGIGDPTASEAMRLATPLRFVELGNMRLEWPEDWLRVISETYASMGRDAFIVARDRYLGNVDYRTTCAKLTIGEAYYYKLLNMVRSRAKECAIEYQLIKVCRKDVLLTSEDILRQKVS